MRLLAPLLLVCLAILLSPPRVALPAARTSAALLLSEVQLAGDTPSDEFIEIYNASDSPIDLYNHQLVYRTQNGTQDSLRYQWTANVILPARRHLLLTRIASSDGDGYNGAVSGDAQFDAGLGDNGALALLDPGGQVLDAVGWGSAANAYVEGSPAPQPVAGQSIERRPGSSDGNATDTDDNAADWAARALPDPQNMSHPPAYPGAPTYTPTPTDTPTVTPTFTATPTDTPTPTPTVTPTPIPTPTPTAHAPGSLLIHEVQYDPPEEGTDAPYEWVELYNPGGQAIALAGWRIADNGGSDALPDLTVPPGGFAVIAADAAHFMARFPTYAGLLGALADGRLGNGLDNDGDRLQLTDPAGAAIDALSWGSDVTFLNPAVPDAAAGHSLEREPPGRDTDAAADWVDRFPPSPGGIAPPTPTPAATPTASATATASPTHTATTMPTATPTARPTATPTPSPTPHAPGAVVINEVLYDPAESGVDAAYEWAELVNRSGQTILLSGWQLADDAGSDLLADVTLPAGGFLVVAADAAEFLSRHPGFSGLLVSVADGRLGFGLNNDGDRLILLDPAGAVMDALSWGSDTAILNPAAPDVVAGHTLAREPSGHDTDTAADWADHFPPSPGGAPPPTPTPTRTPTRRPAPTATPTLPPTATPTLPTAPTPHPPGSLVIHEVSYDPLAGGIDTANEWFELLNRTDTPIALAGWTVQDAQAADLLPAVTVPPGGLLIVAARAVSFTHDFPGITVPVVELADGRIGNGLSNDGDRLVLLDPAGAAIDALSWGNDTAIFDPAAPDVAAGHTLEREPPGHDTDTAADWADRFPPSPGDAPSPTPTPTTTAAPTVTETPPPTATTTATATASPTPTATLTATPTATATATATPAAPPSVTPTATPSLTPTATAPPAPARPLRISEFLYDGTADGEGDEFVEILNPLAAAVDIGGYRLGDAEAPDKNEGMYAFPPGSRMEPGHVIVVARNAAAFAARFGHLPDYELAPGGADTPAVPNLLRVAGWGRGSWSLANDGDEILLLGPQGEPVDTVAYGTGDFAAAGVTGSLHAAAPAAAHRVATWDSGDMRADFAVQAPTPGQPLTLPVPAVLPPVALPDGMFAYWGEVRGRSRFGDGDGPPFYAYAVARAHGLHFLALTDAADALDGGTWEWLGLSADAATVPGQFVALRGFTATDGGATFAVYGSELWQGAESVRDGLIAHPGALAMLAAPAALPFDPALADAVFAAEGDESAYRRALAAGWRTGPALSANAGRDWGGGPLRTGIVAPALTPADVLDAFRARRLVATTDATMALALRGDGGWMGSTVAAETAHTLSVLYADAEGEAVTLELYDRDILLAQQAFGGQGYVDWQVPIAAAAGHAYHARAVQADGDSAWTAPLWMAGDAAPETIRLNEMLPAPHAVDWDGNGVADAEDEWAELYNPHHFAVALAGWTLADDSRTYTLPPGTVIPARGFLVLYRAQTGLALDNVGDTVTLRRADGSVADAFTFDGNPGPDRSWSRRADGDGDWTTDADVTPGQPNHAHPPPLPTATPTPAPPPGSDHQRTGIAEARALPAGTIVILMGQITTPPPYFGSSITIQDGWAGISVLLVRGAWPAGWREGDWLRVTGVLDDNRGELQVRVANPTHLEWLWPGDGVQPADVRTGQIDEAHEGLLVFVLGTVVDVESSAVWLDDGSGAARIFVRESTGWRRPALRRGQVWGVVGVVSQFGSQRPYTDGYRLLPRYPTDFVPPPDLLPEVGGTVGDIRD